MRTHAVHACGQAELAYIFKFVEVSVDDRVLAEHHQAIVEGKAAARRATA